MWLGPRPTRPYQDNIAPYRFRWWQLYSSQMGNWGVHYLDVIRWCCGDFAPASVCAMGGQFGIEDDRTIPDTMEATFQFTSGRLAVFGQYETSQNAALKAGEVELRVLRRPSTSAQTGTRWCLNARGNSNRGSPAANQRP